MSLSPSSQKKEEWVKRKEGGGDLHTHTAKYGTISSFTQHYRPMRKKEQEGGKATHFATVGESVLLLPFLLWDQTAVVSDEFRVDEAPQGHRNVQNLGHDGDGTREGGRRERLVEEVLLLLLLLPRFLLDVPQSALRAASRS